MVTRGLDWIFRSRHDGRITIGQWPNCPLWLFMASSGAAWLAGPGPAGRIAHAGADACLVWWAGDELLRGVNPWRRCLGGAVLAWMVWSWLGGRTP